MSLPYESKKNFKDRSRTPLNHVGWYVTFADLMGVLLSFFVVLVASSVQDEKKKNLLSGSFSDAFGTSSPSTSGGLIELDGLPTRPYLQHLSAISPQDASFFMGPQAGKEALLALAEKDPGFQSSLLLVKIRQALQAIPEIAELSKQIFLEKKEEGVLIQIVDQENRPMFAESEKEPNEDFKRILKKLAEVLQTFQNPIQIIGHTSARGSQKQGASAYGSWELSADRANAVRRILEQDGVSPRRFYSIEGKADTAPLFAEDPFLSLNRRIAIFLKKMEPVASDSTKP